MIERECGKGGSAKGESGRAKEVEEEEQGEHACVCNLIPKLRFLLRFHVSTTVAASTSMDYIHFTNKRASLGEEGGRGRLIERM